MSIQERLKDFILSQFGADKELQSLEPDDDLVKHGIVDSMGVLMVVNFIESSYNTQVQEQEITVENFRSINAIANLIEEKTGARESH